MFEFEHPNLVRTFGAVTSEKYARIDLLYEYAHKIIELWRASEYIPIHNKLKVGKFD